MMSRFLHVAVLVFVCFSVFGKSLKINGTAEDMKDGEKVKLYSVLGPEIKQIESTEVKKGSFSFKVNLDSRGFYKVGLSPTNSDLILLTDDDVDIAVKNKDFSKVTFKDSKENKLYNDYESFNIQYVQKMKELQAKADQARTLNAKNPAKAQEMFNNAKEDFDSVLKSRGEKYRSIVANNPGSYMAKLCGLYLKVDTIPKEEFFEEEEIRDEELQKSEAFVIVASTYFQRFLSRQPEAAYWAEAKKHTNKFEVGSVERELMYLSFIHALAVTLNPQSAARFAKGYKREYPDSEYQKAVAKKLPALPLGVGDVAPEIAFPNPEGEIMKLSDTRGKVVLLDFWASWCGPCRRENPNVVRAYKKYKDKGFTVFSVSLDKAQRNWEAAIERDGLEWDTHVSDLKGWSSEPARLYGVRGIPAAFLLDKNGVIVAQNLRGAALDQKLKELLGE